MRDSLSALARVVTALAFVTALVLAMLGGIVWLWMPWEAEP